MADKKYLTVGMLRKALSFLDDDLELHVNFGSGEYKVLNSVATVGFDEDNNAAVLYLYRIPARGMLDGIFRDSEDG